MGFQNFLESSGNVLLLLLGSGEDVGSQRTVPSGFPSSFLQMLFEKRKFKSTNSCFPFGGQSARKTELAPEKPNDKRVFRKGSSIGGKVVSKISACSCQPPRCSDAQLPGKGWWWCELPVAVRRLEV